MRPSLPPRVPWELFPSHRIHEPSSLERLLLRQELLKEQKQSAVLTDNFPLKFELIKLSEIGALKGME